jgi:hypothetical protein
MSQCIYDLATSRKGDEQSDTRLGHSTPRERIAYLLERRLGVSQG